MDMKYYIENEPQQFLVIELNKSKQLRFYPVWLRQNCPCSTCCLSNTTQKLILAKQLAQSKIISVSLLSTLEEPSSALLQITWEDKHISIFALNTLEKLSTFTHKKCPPMLYGQEKGLIQRFIYEELVDDRAIFNVLKAIYTDGLVLVSGIIQEKKTVADLTKKIAPIYQTVYGEVFDIKFTQSPSNIAYSNESIDLHMDLTYYDSPPGLQILHCLSDSEKICGGESIFLDAFFVANLFKQSDPEAFHVLSSYPTTFQKIEHDAEHPAFMVIKKPIFSVNEEAELIGIRWAPNFEGPLMLPHDKMPAYYTAYLKFFNFIDACKKEFGFAFKLEQDEAVLLNNRRMLHGRTEFLDNQRHLQGTYISTNDFKSRLFTLANQLNKDLDNYHLGDETF